MIENSIMGTRNTEQLLQLLDNPSLPKMFSGIETSGEYYTICDHAIRESTHELSLIIYTKNYPCYFELSLKEWSDMQQNRPELLDELTHFQETGLYKRIYR